MALYPSPIGSDFWIPNTYPFWCDWVNCLDDIATNMCSDYTEFDYSPLAWFVTVNLYDSNWNPTTVWLADSWNIIDSITCWSDPTTTPQTPSQLEGTISILNHNTSSWDYTVSIPSTLYLVSYVIMLFFALFFLYFTTLFVWKTWKKLVK